MISPSAGRRLLAAAVILLTSAATTSAFNITVLLSGYPGFEQFNQLLSRTHLAEEINSRRTITVLGLPNDRMATIMQMTEDVQKSILSLHVILDYYDMIKLTKIPLTTKLVATTLYQSSGVANDQQGFINIVHRQDGTFVFGSAMPGAPLVSMLVNSVAAQPFNISVLSVSQPIIAPGMDGSWVQPAAPVPPYPPRALIPAPAPRATPSPPPVVEEEAPPAAPPANASAPAPSPSGSPSPSPSAAPAEDAPADEAQDEADAQEVKKKKSGAAERVVSGVTAGLVIGLASFLAGH